jgi:hypothetical protein
VLTLKCFSCSILENLSQILRSLQLFELDKMKMRHTRIEKKKKTENYSQGHGRKIHGDF